MLANAFRSTAKCLLKRAIRGRAGAVLLLVGLAGCSPEPVGGEAAPLPPQGVLGREEFVRVMTEVQLIEAVADKRIYRNDNERQRYDGSKVVQALKELGQSWAYTPINDVIQSTVQAYRRQHGS